MSIIILIAVYGLIGYLVWSDMAWREAGTRALLIPGVWLAIQGSRPVSYWIGGTGGQVANPIDAAVYAFLIFSAIVVLRRQGFPWARFAAENKALILIYFFFLCSLSWSEFPTTSGKRLFKDFGCVLVGLIFLIQENPAAAIRAVYVRVSYALFPLSMVLIKYFPEIGRQPTRAGENMFTGVTTQKNSLGLTVFVFGIVLLWDLIEIRRQPIQRKQKGRVVLRVTMLLLGLWLLKTCDSKTSLLCLVLGFALYWWCGKLVKMPRGKTILLAGLTTVALLAIMDGALGISDIVIRALGRDPSLTGRTAIWQLVMDQETGPMLGNGFYIFWSGEKGAAVVEAFKQINSAHNGYLEVYLDGGLVGGTLLLFFLLAAGGRVINRLFAGNPLGRVGLIFWLLAIIYNFSESSFFRLDVLWSTVLLLSVTCPRTRQQWAREEQGGHHVPA